MGAGTFGNFCCKVSGCALGFLKSLTWYCEFLWDLSTTVSKLASHSANFSLLDIKNPLSWSCSSVWTLSLWWFQCLFWWTPFGIYIVMYLLNVMRKCCGNYADINTQENLTNAQIHNRGCRFMKALTWHYRTILGKKIKRTFNGKINHKLHELHSTHHFQYLECVWKFWSSECRWSCVIERVTWAVLGTTCIRFAELSKLYF